MFSIFGHFPEDYEFWVSEGLLAERGDETLEESDSGSTKRFNWEIKSCCVHDILRDLSISEAKEDKLLEVHHAMCMHLHLVSAYSQFVMQKCYSSFMVKKGLTEDEKFLYRGFKLIAKLEKLLSLLLSCSCKAGRVPAFVPLKHLSKVRVLCLEGRLEKLLRAREFPSNIIKLPLKFSYLEQDPLVILGQLRSLHFLKLHWDAYVGKVMVLCKWVSRA
ncbi:hypothetical protein ACLOJK_001734 [Asimina triloba]